jgi:hypothetical protein
MAYFALANKAKSPIDLAVLIEKLIEINDSSEILALLRWGRTCAL